MAVENDWISVEKAAEEAGCSPQFIRRELDRHLPKDEDGEPTADRTVGGRIDGWRVHGKAWLVSKASARALRETLSTRANLHRDARQAAKASRKPVRRQAKKRKSR